LFYKGCWGDSYSKEYKDTTVTASWDVANFPTYVNNGMLQDTKALCSYVNSNKAYLNIDPTWIQSRDCIYNQFNALIVANPAYNKSLSDMLIRY
jgi:hypothetical protein